MPLVVFLLIAYGVSIGWVKRLHHGTGCQTEPYGYWEYIVQGTLEIYVSSPVESHGEEGSCLMEGTSSTLYGCFNDNLYYSLYTSTNCSGTPFYSSSISVNEDEYLCTNNSTLSSQLVCSDLVGADYAHFEVYDPQTSGCDASSIIALYYIKVGQCMTFGESGVFGDGFSYKIETLGESISFEKWDKGDCMGDPDVLVMDWDTDICSINLSSGKRRKTETLLADLFGGGRAKYTGLGTDDLMSSSSSLGKTSICGMLFFVLFLFLLL